MQTHIDSIRSRARRKQWAIALLSGFLLAGGARSSPADPGAAADTVDITTVRDKLRVFTDGRKHYIVISPFDMSANTFFYGDGKTFHAQRTFGGGYSGDIAFNRAFWEPRAHGGSESMFWLVDKKYTLSCINRETKFEPVPTAEANAMISGAKFLHALWKRQSYALARDEKARYYYVDRAREPEGNTNFRLYVGPKGNLKLQPMTNVVSDSKGDIFATRNGQMRFVSGDDKSTFWLQGKARTQLVSVPIEDNHALIYTDLGVYTGERLGTPCDDL